jgi:tetratricopeptide (TPR) repeat protein
MTISMTRALMLAFLLFGLALPAYAQEGGEEAPEATETDAEVSDYVLVTQFLEAIEASKWDEAIKRYKELINDFPQMGRDSRLQYLFAQSNFSTDDFKTAKETLEGLLQSEQNHIEALFLLAKVKIKLAKGEDEQVMKTQAKQHLIQSARFGQFVLRDINSKSGQKFFGFLQTDPKFILDVMNASNEFQIPSSRLHNPFKSPLILATEGLESPTEEVGPGPEDTVLERRIEELFRQIVQLAQERQHDELVKKFTELRQIMTEYGEAGTEEVRRKLEKWNVRLAELGEVRLSIKLQIYINEGNRHLRGMQDAIREEQFDAALEHFARIEAVVEDMRNEEREVFHRNADALHLRGQSLADQARRLKKISEFVLDVTGIVVVPPDSDDKDSAIINDRIYREGDTLVDEKTDEEIDGLQIVQIEPQTVKFKFEETPFIRELRPQQ